MHNDDTQDLDNHAHLVRNPHHYCDLDLDEYNSRSTSLHLDYNH